MKTLTLITTALALPLLGAVRINEVQISNDVTLLDENGEHSDWVELYNDSDSVVNLSGWGLTDKASKPYKWVFPQNTLINPHGYLTVFADGRENNDSSPPAPLQPDELGDDLVAWFTGDQALESAGNGSRVQQWVDLSDHQNDAYNNSATEATRPVVVANAVGEHAALCFNATEKTVLNFNKNAFSGMSDMSNLTVLVVAKWGGTYDTGGASGVFGISHNNNSYGQLFMQVMKSPQGRFRARNGAGQAYATAPTPLDEDTWYCLGMGTDSEREVPRISTYINQQRVASVDCEVSSRPLSGASKMTIGLSRTDQLYFDGQIAEFIMFRRQLTDEEYASVYQYLHYKYGLPTAFTIHAGFSLSSDDDGVTLTPPGESSPADSIAFDGDIPCDTSIGRDADGNIVYFAEPTPGRANVEESYEAPLGPVVMSVERGVYEAEFDVRLSYTNDPTARIYYTLDHQDPSPDTGILYDDEEPIHIAGTTILRATVVSDRSLPYRNITSHSYIFLRDVLTQSKPEIAQDVWSDGASTMASYSVSSNVVYDSETEEQLFKSIMACPIVSITMSDYDMFNEEDGLYARPVSLKGQEKYASVEWVSGESVFGLGAGVRIQGNTSPSFGRTPKKSFRLCFRGRYGNGKLKYPVLKDGGCDKASFDSLILRGENHYSWPSNFTPQDGTNMRDQFMRDLQGEISGYQSAGSHVGVFINGMYWGLYNVCERIDDSTAADQFVGEKYDYNVIVSSGTPTVRDGSAAPYKSFINRMQTVDMSIKENYADSVKEIDIRAYIEYMIIKSWTGDYDWPQSNWAVVHSPANNIPFYFYVWDTEKGLTNVKNCFDPSSAKNYSPLIIHNAFLTNSEYRCQFGDVAQRLLLEDDGPLSPEGFARRYADKAQQVRPMIFAESARWGAYRHDAGLGSAIYGLTRWDAVCENLKSFATSRKDTYIRLLRSYGLYPDVEAAEYEMVDESNTAARLDVTAGVAYYTLDGTDPRKPYAEGEATSSAVEYVAGTDISCATGGVVRVRVLSEGKWSALVEFTLEPSEEASGTGKNELIPSTNGVAWDDDENWSLGTYPNGAGSQAVIGIPTKFKKDKGWRNIHIEQTDITVGNLEVTCGGFTNRIDTGTSGNLTFDGGDADATVYLMDEANPSLLMFDLDAPNVVRLATDTIFVVSNSVGDARYGGVLCKGVWDGGGKNLEKQGAGLMTIDFTNTPETAFSKIQVTQGEVAILKPVYADSITKKDGILSVSLGSTDVDAAVESAVKLSSKLSVGNVNLFVPSYAGGATWYGAVVAGVELAPKKCRVFVRDDQGSRSFDGKRYREITDATINAKVPTGDGRVTYGVTMPVQNVTVLTDSRGKEQTFDSSADNGELVALLKSGGKLQIKDAEVSVDDASHTVTIDGVAYTVPTYYSLQLDNGQISKTFNETARPVLLADSESGDDALVVKDNEVQLSVGTLPGLDYTIQTTGSLNEPVWTDGEIIHGDGTVKQLKAEKVGASGFYRVKATD